MANIKFLTRKRIIEFILVCHIFRNGISEVESSGSAKTLIQYFSSTLKLNLIIVKISYDTLQILHFDLLCLFLKLFIHSR